VPSVLAFKLPLVISSNKLYIDSSLSPTNSTEDNACSIASLTPSFSPLYSLSTVLTALRIFSALRNADSTTFSFLSDSSVSVNPS